MSDSLITVVIPVYNGEKYLEETIRSSLASLHRPLEVIVVNDGSTDSSLAIADSLAVIHPELKVISQENAGVSAALNTGCSAAKGIYLFPLGADDLISEHYLAKLPKFLI
ncbi:glycosyltransferase family A protein [Algoriphagus boritolerans]|uniref:glycosyltransferase family 2 protein n=1 Tax=Algoriphagus boritolerans TaxID=308111 RepID=UPI000A3F2D78